MPHTTKAIHPFLVEYKFIFFFLKLYPFKTLIGKREPAENPAIHWG
jgi:hypothetical protein